MVYRIKSTALLVCDTSDYRMNQPLPLAEQYLLEEVIPFMGHGSAGGGGPPFQPLDRPAHSAVDGRDPNFFDRDGRMKAVVKLPADLLQPTNAAILRVELFRISLHLIAGRLFKGRSLNIR